MECFSEQNFFNKMATNCATQFSPALINRLKNLQIQIAQQVVIEPCPKIKTIIGLDVAYDSHQKLAAAAAVVFSFPQLQRLQIQTIVQKLCIPYLPGLFAFRELPLLFRVLKHLPSYPHSLIMCDGHGLAHPRRCGLATHLGVKWHIPTIGVAKNKLIGSFYLEHYKRGAAAFVTDQNQIIGAVLCTQHNVKPVFVSVGNRITLEQALEITLKTAITYRIPEPLRQAHQFAQLALKKQKNM